MLRLARFAAALLALAGCRETPVPAGSDLARYLDTLTAVDSHAHPMAVVPAGAPADSDYDALPLSGIPPFDVPVGLRPDQAGYYAAQQALFGLTAEGDSVQVKRFVAAASAAIAQRGEAFPVWALDQAHIGTMLANRVAMGAGLAAPRFRWVSFADPLMLPLDVTGEAARTADTKALYPLETKLLQRYLRDLGLARIPPTLEAYHKDVVTATLERQKAQGAVAIKFEAAYLRSLDFRPTDPAQAAAIYRRYAGGGVPTAAEYRLLEDHLAFYLAREAGRLGLAVQIHSLDGFGGAFSAEGAAPHNLEPMVSEPSLRETHFVVVHGGWPRVAETMGLLGRTNTYADISMMTMVAGHAALTATLRTWLTSWPDKVLFGTDAFDGGPQQGWEQGAWLASRNARRALAEALGGMVRDGEISAERARQIGRMVLRENAAKAYRL